MQIIKMLKRRIGKGWLIIYSNCRYRMSTSPDSFQYKLEYYYISIINSRSMNSTRENKTHHRRKKELETKTDFESWEVLSLA